MQHKQPIQLDERIHLIDGFDLGVPHRTGTYVIDEQALTLVETGPSPSIKYVKQGLSDLGFTLNQVTYIIITHVHLDHAGGAGLLIQACPNATVIVHPRGARHLIDPKRLTASARTVYGDSFQELFDPVIPVPEDRLITKDEGDKLVISPTCELTFLDTPGHAKHHLSIYDPVSNGIFTGDTVGIRYDQLIPNGVDLFLPSTSPNQFNPTAMRDAIKRIQQMQVDRIYFGHFSMTEKVDEALKQVSTWLERFERTAKEVYQEKKGYNELAVRLLQQIKNELRPLWIEDDHAVYAVLNVDMQVSALGMIDYLQKQNE